MWELQCLSDVILDKPLPGDKIRLPSNILSQYITTKEAEHNERAAMEIQENDNEAARAPDQTTSPASIWPASPSLQRDVERPGQPRAAVETQSHDIEFPISFKLRYKDREIVTSVLDFSGEDNVVIIPHWIMCNLFPLEIGDMIFVEVYSGGYETKTLPKGTKICLRPHSKDFLEITDHRAVLEHILKEYSILNEFTTIGFGYCDRQYNLDIVLAEPESIIDIIDTDLIVDFKEPVDYVEVSAETSLERPPAEASIEQDGKQDDETDGDAKESNEFVPFSGKGYTLGR